MKVSSAALLALVASASAHTLMSEIYIDGKAQVSSLLLHHHLYIYTVNCHSCG